MPDWETAAWPRAEHLSRVFHIRSGASCGTAFALDVGGRQYLVSAFHVVEDSIKSCLVDICFQNSWKPFVVNIVGFDPDADIAVLALQERVLADGLPIDVGDAGCVAGQEVFILGFPLGIRGYLASPGFPIPLIKRGVAALFNPGPPTSVYISASANPGFSGGPVYFASRQTGKATLMAVVSNEFTYEMPVKNSEGVVIGKVQQNSNIVECSYISHALALIQASPIGLTIS